MAFFKWALLEDAQVKQDRQVAEEGNPVGAPPVYWVLEKARNDEATATLIADLEKEAEDEEESRVALLAVAMGAGLDTPEAVGRETVEIDKVLEIGSDDEGVLVTGTSVPSHVVEGNLKSFIQRPQLVDNIDLLARPSASPPGMLVYLGLGSSRYPGTTR